MKRLNDILGYEGLKIYQDSECFSFSLDSVMLANFVNIRMNDKKIVDLGTGNGVIPLILAKRTGKSNIIGVEIQDKLCELARESVLYNGYSDKINIVNCDMKEFVSNDLLNSFDLVTCNPPYFKYNELSSLNESIYKLIARHEVKIKLSDIFEISKRLLKEGGKFCIVHRPERLIDILDEFKKNNIEPKRMRFVYESLDKDAIIVLIEGIKNGNSGLKIENPFILYNLDGSKTDEYNQFLTEVRK